MKRHKKCVHQKAGAVNDNEEMLYVSDEHLSCSDDEDREERDGAVACEDNIGADKMPVYRNIFDAMQSHWALSKSFPKAPHTRFEQQCLDTHVIILYRTSWYPLSDLTTDYFLF
ncbi:hypothetical protein PoB_006464900 [Plakobranchus ocellatus]|uniref:Uncharacterized protein n=1 Tax=Plakobranchus ocellatus TaxID=259542 RepID=A0AAV4D1V5_9GAST|nr:hypothetical protein PoB_006464900 [Plakobranchus ocellatus]